MWNFQTFWKHFFWSLYLVKSYTSFRIFSIKLILVFFIYFYVNFRFTYTQRWYSQYCIQIRIQNIRESTHLILQAKKKKQLSYLHLFNLEIYKTQIFQFFNELFFSKFSYGCEKTIYSSCSVCEVPVECKTNYKINIFWLILITFNIVKLWYSRSWDG